MKRQAPEERIRADYRELINDEANEGWSPSHTETRKYLIQKYGGRSEKRPNRRTNRAVYAIVQDEKARVAVLQSC